MNRLLIIVFAFIIVDVSQAQVDMVSFEEYFNSFSNDEGISDDKRQALYPLYFKSPLIDEAEFRTETNEFDLSQQEYTLRLSPNSKKIRKYQNRIYQDLKNEYLFELRQSQEDYLEDLYNTYLDYYFDIQELNLRKQILPIYEDIITMLSKQNKDGELSVSDLITASKERDKLLIRIERDQQRLNAQKDLAANSPESIIAVDDLEKIFAMIIGINMPTQTYEEHKFELNRIENQYQLEKAEKDKLFDFAQIRYNSDPEDIWQEKINLGFAFRFPHSSKSSLDLIELQLEKMIEEEKFERQKREIEESIQENYTNFLEQFENYNSAQKLISTLKKYEELTKSIQPSSKREIVDILELNIESIEEEIDVISVKKDLYDSYIELAKAMGYLQITSEDLHLKLLSPELVNLISK